jgi:hypothetical protein
LVHLTNLKISTQDKNERQTSLNVRMKVDINGLRGNTVDEIKKN